MKTMTFSFSLDGVYIVLVMNTCMYRARLYWRIAKKGKNWRSGDGEVAITYMVTTPAILSPISVSLQPLST